MILDFVLEHIGAGDVAGMEVKERKKEGVNFLYYPFLMASLESAWEMKVLRSIRLSVRRHYGKQ